MKFGYIREWEEEQGQSPIRQSMLEQVEDDRFLFGDIRTRSFDRRNYLFLRNMLRAGDVLFVDELDSLGYTLEDMAAEWQLLTKQLQVDVVVLQEAVQLDSRMYKAMGEAGVQMEQQMLNLLLYMSKLQQRREEEQQRISPGSAVQEGKKSGRPPLQMDWELFHATAQRWAAGEIDAQEACDITGSARSSWYKYTRELGYVRNNKRTKRK